MTGILKKHWPLAGSVLLYWLLLMIHIVISINRNDGHFIYPVDDAYIHMSVAKNTVLYGVWGVTKYEFTSSISSPLWGAILTLTYFITGVNEISPLILNILFGTLALAAAYIFIKNHIKSDPVKFIILIIAVVAVHLHVVTIIGMEHVLHTLLTIVFLYFSFESLFKDTNRLQRNETFLIVTAILLSAVRYESLFTIFAVCFALIIKRKYLIAVLIITAGAVPVIIYGTWSVSNGWWFLPNPVLLKGNVPGFSLREIWNFVDKGAVEKLRGNVNILIPFLAAVFFMLYYLSRNKRTGKEVYQSAILSSIILLHMQFASAGFFRYEAYIVFITVIITGIIINKFAEEIREKSLKRAGAVFLLVLLFFSYAPGIYRSNTDTPVATSNIYQQQYQMGFFLKKYYTGKTVALNDIGAPTFLADIKLLDLAGLGNIETAKLIKEKRYTWLQIDSLSKEKNVAIAMVYDIWFPERTIGLPREWLQTGKWVIPDNVVCGDDEVSIYAPSEIAQNQLIKNLKAFSSELNNNVKESGIYKENNRQQNKLP